MVLRSKGRGVLLHCRVRGIHLLLLGQRLLLHHHHVELRLLLLLHVSLLLHRRHLHPECLLLLLLLLLHGTIIYAVLQKLTLKIGNIDTETT